MQKICFIFYRQLQMTLNFLSLPDLLKAVQQNQRFQQQIKGKRIRKELSNLQQYTNTRLTFKKYEINPYGISFYIQTMCGNKLYDFEIMIDEEYPFNRPQIFYQNESSPYSSGMNLLDSLLNGTNWGPSLLLSGIFDKLPQLAGYLHDKRGVVTSVYHTNQCYLTQFLQKYKISLFQIEEYQWKYLIKSTSKRVVGLTKEHFLKFSQVNNKLRLDNYWKIKDLKQVNATVQKDKFKLQMVATVDQKQKKLYLGGDLQDMQKMLFFMDPISMIQRRLSRTDKDGNESLEKKIEEYSQLIEYYSSRDQAKTNVYLGALQQLSIRCTGEKEERGLDKLQEDIKT